MATDGSSRRRTESGPKSGRDRSSSRQDGGSSRGDRHHSHRETGRERDRTRERERDHDTDQSRSRSHRDRDRSYRDRERGRQDRGRNDRDRNRTRDYPARERESGRRDRRGSDDRRREHTTDARGSRVQTDMAAKFRGRDQRRSEEAGKRRGGRGDRNGERASGSAMEVESAGASGGGEGRAAGGDKAKAKEESRSEPAPPVVITLPISAEEAAKKAETARLERKRRRAEILARHKKKAAVSAVPKAKAPPAVTLPSADGAAAAAAAAATTVGLTPRSSRRSPRKNGSGSKSKIKSKPTRKPFFDIFSTAPAATDNAEDNGGEDDDGPDRKRIKGTRGAVSKLVTNSGDNHHENETMADNWDDPQGYYAAQIGELLDGRYIVKNKLGQGVFSTVLYCEDTQSIPEPGQDVAIKLIRANETMSKAGEKELSILQELAAHNHAGRQYNVQLLAQFTYRGHLCLVFEPLQMNLRMLLKKMAKDVGINILAVQRFAKQLFLALRQLQVLNIVHADLKPDNILVSENHHTIKICDFGSAFKADDHENEPTPYLVSRFYRAPEIVLALPYDTAIDVWAAGCCLYEMYTSKVLFSGKSNNQMLDKFMEIKGKVPHKMIKKHWTNYEMLGGMPPHFDHQFRFIRHELDPVSKRDVVRLITVTKNTRDLGDMLNAHIGTNANRKLVLQLKDLLSKCFILDPAKRITAKEALQHPFISSLSSKRSKAKKDKRHAKSSA